VHAIDVDEQQRAGVVRLAFLDGEPARLEGLPIDLADVRRASDIVRASSMTARNA